LTLEGPDLDC